MLDFKKFIIEEAEKEPLKLKHLTHAEDHIIDDGEKGFHKAAEVLHQAHEHITTGHSESKLTTKYDGSPSIVFGHHPQTGKFFVATKSAFNKTPKINYTEKDIEENHGHAPGLVQKLKEALHHLPKVAPKNGVYQGDLMYGEGDVLSNKTHHHFTPNTITYSAPRDSEEGKKIEKSKLGIVVHTKYHGSTLDNMHAGFEPDTNNFNHHKDVNMIDPNVDTSSISHSKKDELNYQSHMKAAKKAFQEAHHETFNATAGHKEHLNTYINHTVRTGEAPTPKGFKQHLRTKYNSAIDKLKTDKAKLAKQKELDNHLSHVDEHEEKYGSLFKMHHHLQKAKDALVNSLSSHQKFTHQINGTETGPEGFVITHHGEPTKLVNRADFSRQNLLKVKNK